MSDTDLTRLRLARQQLENKLLKIERCERARRAAQRELQAAAAEVQRELERVRQLLER